MAENNGNLGQPCGEVTRLLHQLRAGDADAANVLFHILYDELRRVARQVMSSERGEHTLQPTALVNEAYLKMACDLPANLQDRSHFLAIAARAMRRVLVEHARARNAKKRWGKPLRVELNENLLGHESSDQIVALDDSLKVLEQRDPQQAQIVELRFFGGMTNEEAAQALDISASTVKRDWNMAKAWLYSEMTK